MSHFPDFCDLQNKKERNKGKKAVDRYTFR